MIHPINKKSQSNNNNILKAFQNLISYNTKTKCHTSLGLKIGNLNWRGLLKYSRIFTTHYYKIVNKIIISLNWLLEIKLDKVSQ